MNNLMNEYIEALSSPIVIISLLFLIGYYIWYKQKGQYKDDENYKQRKEEILKERNELEKEKEEFEKYKEPKLIYVKDSDSTILLIFLIISILLNFYLLHELQEYYHIFGELKEMSEFLKMLL